MATGQSLDRRPAVAFTAVRISSVTASGWETIEACDAGISTIAAFARSAMCRCVAGGIALSSLPSMYHDGTDRQATGPEGAPNAFR
jgi:hypothetical protein